MPVTLGWMLLASLTLVRPTTYVMPAAPSVAAAPGGGRIALWIDRDEPYVHGQDARVHIRVEEPSYVAVFRVDTDGRIHALLPREPWTDTYVRERREFEVAGVRGGRSFEVDDDPGVGYLFAVAAAEPLDFRDITRGDDWDYRLMDGGRIQGDPYVSLTDLAERLAPGGDYDYDIAPYYVDRHYAYPRFVCYDCHAYASYREWNPYSASCTRYRVVIRDDPRYYPYRYGGRNVVTARPAHPGPRYLFRDADPSLPSVTRLEPARRPFTEDEPGRSSQDVGGRGSVPAPGYSELRRGTRESVRDDSGPRAVERDEDGPRAVERDEGGRRAVERDESGRRAVERGESGRRAVEPRAHPQQPPQSTGEPELRRRRP